MSLSAIGFLIVVGVVIPVLAYTSKRHLDRGMVIPRLPFYAEAIALQTLLLVGSFYVASRNRIILFRRFDVGRFDVLLGFALFAAAVATMMIGWRLADLRTKERVAVLVPGTSAERVVWAAVSLAASFGEEVAYRGVILSLLQRMLRNWWIAAAISSALFALAHLLQGWRSAAVVGVFGYLFHLLVLATGGLYVAIVVHFAYDLAAGWMLGARVARAQGATHEAAV